MIDFSAQPLVETAWLAAHLSDADVRIVDARWRDDGTSREIYQRGLIPGAIHLDWYHDLSWRDARGVRNGAQTRPFLANENVGDRCVKKNVLVRVYL
jgi:3-mercaptopyruvate sulfurtransferase SseA